MSSKAVSPPFTAVLLAGGASRRMGCDKAGLLFRGVPLWQHQLATLRAARPDQLLMSSRPGRVYEGAAAELVFDTTPGFGPLAGLAAGLRQARYATVFVLAVDLPRITSAFVSELVFESGRQGRGLVPRSPRGLEPLCAVYSRACAPLAEQCLRTPDLSMQEFVRRAAACGLLAEHPIAEDRADDFANLNTPADWRAIAAD